MYFLPAREHQTWDGAGVAGAGRGSRPRVTSAAIWRPPPCWEATAYDPWASSLPGPHGCTARRLRILCGARLAPLARQQSPYCFILRP